MLKKTITYEDYDGNKRTEDFYFHLTKAEVTEMEMSTEGGLVKTIEKIVASQDGERTMSLFKSIILKAYGEKSLDGKRFVKNDEVRDSFVQTEAYSQLFMELVTNADEASKFVNAVVPDMGDASQKAAAEKAKQELLIKYGYADEVKKDIPEEPKQ